ncbi:MAG TPA: hypothetical protein VG672_06135 [Bryobacteraceae bacterium]|nr:hypothetical protein [Bryobacteraceae bacterium]
MSLSRRNFLAVPGLALAATRGSLAVSTFRIDTTPPIGSPLGLGTVVEAKKIDDPVGARGMILHGAGQPIVLCAFDWIGICNLGHDEFRDTVAQAAGTAPERVLVHVLHQHDAPGYDPGADRILDAEGLGGRLYDREFMRSCLARLRSAVAEAARRPQPVTELRVGSAKVEQVASNRRVLGADGKVRYGRMSSCRIPEAIAAPEGTVDPYVRSISFWNGARAAASLTYYTTHPQSHYNKGAVSADFVGAARSLREKEAPSAFHLHFNGASGNVAAGKYNNGALENRAILAGRLADGMRRAWESAEKHRLEAAAIRFRSTRVRLPIGAREVEANLRKEMHDASLPMMTRLRAGRDLSWTTLHATGRTNQIAVLDLGPVLILHMPGELFVEYQLAAQKMAQSAGGGRPLATAAYGDLGMGYIGTAAAYPQGGYETGVVSRVGPQVEAVLMEGMEKVIRS